MGLLPDNASLTGAIRFQGHDLTRLGDRQFSALRGHQMTMVFQEPMTALDPTMKVGRQAGEVLGLHQRRTAGATRGRVEEIFARVGLDQASRVADAYPHELSGGQRQRVVIAMALINSPALVICDEPTTALDTTVQATVMAVLAEELAAVNAGCLFISHDLALVASLCPEVAVIQAGQIVECGDTRAMFAQARHPYTRGLIATANIDAVPAGARLPVIEDFLDPGRVP
jgi:ABC-type dipeptide/oligopeptide/nickel transport system ATPase component